MADGIARAFLALLGLGMMLLWAAWFFAFSWTIAKGIELFFRRKK